MIDPTKPNREAYTATAEEKADIMRVIGPYYASKYGCTVCGRKGMEMMNPQPEQLYDTDLMVATCPHCGGHTLFNFAALF